MGPIAANFVDASRFGSAQSGQQSEITLGVARVVIGVQLVIAGFQLPAKFCQKRWLETAIVLIPLMTIMWMATTACIVLTIPKLTLLGSMTIAAAVTCTDPVLSQAVAKGPFADKYVPRALRELISVEAGANDGFALAFLLLAVFLIRHADVNGLTFRTPEIAAEVLGGGNQVLEAIVAPVVPPVTAPISVVAPAFGGEFGQVAPAVGQLIRRAAEGDGIPEGVGRLGGGLPRAMQAWFVEGWLYSIIMSVAIGATVGYCSMLAIKFGLRRKWIDGESFLLWPTAMGLFLIGVCGTLYTSDLLACFAAGCALNWNGLYLEESLKRHDEVNSCIDVLLNFGGFMYIGTIIPWSQFQMPDVTGITVGRLFLLGFLVLFFRRVPAVMLLYKTLPKCVKTWKEALFMGWFGPIGEPFL
jgi:NhaP-type Na+/H+ or K+/H+ antiporter